ncbi:hypothetical protein CONPUDRAFT_144702 [Coniophora puteana RWD-64-598 SS2]|uniref:MYND-type domain-containing protein n=1 Tax=Coniophora puteana (strain RWD-64-598) TaxID=741705 RepID=A0A5M3MQI6_CONPW|nr:uncharacterized protein CONPUDRAFT_144702 [Coniophora puteana RWD-64-598 SS2]EIW80761.1 hypothetical protein CONPUDRAFT_144702 [Coniophora puteana RWD-64-598 SS2]
MTQTSTSTIIRPQLVRLDRIQLVTERDSAGSAWVTKINRALDFTCCDIEAGVLARNTILFTLLSEGKEEAALKPTLDLLWNTFFDIFIDKFSFALLFVHVRNLLEASRSMDAWKASPYHRYISFCDHDTLTAVHQCWKMYDMCAGLNDTRSKAAISNHMQGVKWVVSDPGPIDFVQARSAGLFRGTAARALLRGYDRFWTDGVMAFDEETSARAIYVNHTMTYSRAGWMWNVDLGSYPLACFHLTEVFATAGLEDAKMTRRADKEHDELLLKEIIPAAKKQFYAWCTSLANVFREDKKTLSTLAEDSSPAPPPFLVRIACGDALAFCKALQYYRETGSPETPIATAPFSLSRFAFDASSPPPSAFDAIGTSTLTDDLGLLNILTHTTPLLKRSSFAALYTESVTTQPERGDAATTGAREGGAVLESAACCDIGTLSLLLGVVPVAHISGFAMHAAVDEMDTRKAARGFGYRIHERVVWRRPVMPVPVPGAVVAMSVDVEAGPTYRLEFISEELAGALYGVYQRMFGDDENGVEDIVSRMKGLMSEDPSGAGSEDTKRASPYTDHYTRRAFAELLVVARSQFGAGTSASPTDDANFNVNVETNWTRTMNALIDLICNDNTQLGGIHSHLQDLYTQLHLLGLHTADHLQPSKSELTNASSSEAGPRGEGGVFSGWPSVPPTVHIVLVVPRTRIDEVRPLLEPTRSPGELGSTGAWGPVLRCVVLRGPTSESAAGEGTEQVFESVDAAFGELVSEDEDGSGGEDKREHTGGGDFKTRTRVRVVPAKDKRGLKGTADLIVSFEVPTAVLAGDMSGLSVALALRGSECTANAKARSLLGSKLHLFRSDVSDERHVRVVPCSPFLAPSFVQGNNSTPLEKPARSRNETSTALVPVPKNQHQTATVRAAMDDKREKVASMVVRVDVLDVNVRESLESGADVTMVLASACAVRVAWKGYVQVHSFPLPIDFKEARVHVERKEWYVEIAAPVASSMLCDNMKFPVLFTDKGPAIWNMHRVALDNLPLLKLLPKTVRIARSVINHADLTLSPRERSILGLDQDGTKRETATSDANVNDGHKAFAALKRSIFNIFCGSATHPAPIAFRLGAPSASDPCVIVFVTGLRLDVGGGGGGAVVVADAWVVTVTREIMSELGPLALPYAGAKGRVVGLDVVDGPALRAWKVFLPAAVERCRTWAHGEGCEYRVRGGAGGVLLALDEGNVVEGGSSDDDESEGVDPICSCGRGIGVAEQEPFRKQWRSFAPYVTRAALSPLFPVPCYEQGAVAPGGKEEAGKGGASGTVCFACGGRGKPSLLTCGRCKRARYCSAECQRRDWKEKHKLVCAGLADGRI